MRDTGDEVTLQSDSGGVDMTDTVDLHEHSNEVFCALFLNGDEWKTRTSSTVGPEEQLPIHKETSNGRCDTRETLTVPSLQF